MYKAQLTQIPQLSQKTSITPRLQQALKVLNMPLQELTHFIHQQLEQNPFLELDEENELTTPAEELDPAPEWSEPEANLDQEDTAVDIDWETAFEDRVSLSENMNSKQIDTDEIPPDTVYECSLHDYLIEQLDLIPANIITSNTERTIAEYILGNLNTDGKLELKLFQIPCEFLPTLEAGKLSPELHTAIQNGLQTETTGNAEVKFSKTAVVSSKKLTHTSQETESTPIIKYAWKINDLDNGKTYTIKYEQIPYSCKPALNFYQLTLEDIAEIVGCETTLVETVLRQIQDNFEPLGIAHRDTSEALLIQIRNQKPENIPEITENLSKIGSPGFLNKNLSVQAVAKEIIENHFDAFLNQKWDYLAEVLKIDIAVIDTIIKWIGTLSPYPGRYFTDPTVQFLKGTPRIDRVTPDVEIQFLNGKCQAVSVDSYVPRLHINPYYLNLMRNEQGTLDAGAKEWIEKRYRDALNLINSLAQRGSTIARVTEAIFEVQTNFLTEGGKSIKPLTLKTIAEQVGVHESTVSRVTSNKYVQTPHGMYPLRFFFSNELTTTQGEAVSAKQVKNFIQEMINAETPTKPLSDQAISNALKVKGVILARRTVQKYRDELGIPTSRERSTAHASTRAN